MGRIWKYGDHVNTDLIIPGRYLDDYDIENITEHAMEDIDPNFSSDMEPGDIILAGKNFGCGSSREQAPLVLKKRGVSVVIAKSFARIFFRNAVATGLPIVVCPEAHHLLEGGDEVEIDIEEGEIHRVKDDLVIPFDPLPPFLLDILNDDGLVNHLRKRFNR